MRFILIFIVIVLLVGGCAEKKLIAPTRESKIPQDILKGTPENDQPPPILHSTEYEQPVPLAIISTAGAEDSPFIPEDRDELYFMFVKDVREDVHIQIRDFVNGIWVSKKINNAWQEPEFVQLQNSDKLALNGCEFVQGNEMLFCTAREGYTGLHWFSAEYKDNKWTNWKESDFPTEYDVGELHIWKDELYYHSNREDGNGGSDIWMLKRINDKWSNPTNIKAVNSEIDEGMPYITSDGKEMWFNKWHKGSPAVFRSKKSNEEWQEPELIVSSFAGEPTLDKEGNLYFVHHYYKDNEMIEADIYIAYKIKE